MTIEISCSELGVHDCDWVATGETAGDVVEQVVRHLRKDQKINMPDAETILEGDFFEDPIGDATDPAASMIVRRLREALNLTGTAGTTPDAGPVAGRLRSP